MNKIDWVEIAQGVLAVGGWVFGRALSKYSAMKKDWDEIKKSQVLQAQSLKRAWEEIEKIRMHRPGQSIKITEKD